jgi:hypothetical protein
MKLIYTELKIFCPYLAENTLLFFAKTYELMVLREMIFIVGKIRNV